MADQLRFPVAGFVGRVVKQAGHTTTRRIGSPADGGEPMGAPAANGDESPDRTPPDGDDGHLFPVPHIHEAVAPVRRRAQALLVEWELPADCLDDALMVISELITNAVLHALPPAVLRLCWSENEGCPTLRIEVTDGGPVPCDQLPDEEIEPDEHGRGLSIVTALSARHGTRTGSDRVTRWAELPVAA
ncbi:ATP-binding protein [Streptomyces sp. NPDC005355]|uniref:ATP-binding protein n=1 Tax=Streptomyces sp. NPDC005355 TaxID=3157038 RepID=UPI0033B52282